MTPAARISGAIDLLGAIESAPERPADAVASEFFRARRFIGGSDRRAIGERVWGVIRARRRLGWVLGGAATPRTLMAAHLLLREGWDAEGIAQAHSGGRFAPEPLDAAEQRLIAGLRPTALHDPAMPPAVRHEVPDWLLPLLEERFGADLPRELAALGEAAPLDLRANLLKVTRAAAAAALAAEELPVRPTALSPWGLRAAPRANVTATQVFRDGLVEIQDEGSQLVALLTDARPGHRVADWCAGAGGKTLALAMMMENRGHIVACDVSATRLDGAVRRLRRAGVHNVERHLFTAGDRWARRHAGGFDRVLVDAPCTGTGTWRRNPDSRARLREADLAELLPKQAAILDQAARTVKPGGRLIYATCSLLNQENEAQMIGFMSRTPDFSPIPVRAVWPGAPTEADTLSLSPARHGTDGFFIAVMERRA